MIKVPMFELQGPTEIQFVLPHRKTCITVGLLLVHTDYNMQKGRGVFEIDC